MYCFKRVDVLLPEDTEKAQEFIGQDCYFGNNLEQKKRAVQYKRIGILKCFGKMDKEYVYITAGKRGYKLILPASKVQIFSDDTVAVL